MRRLVLRIVFLAPLLLVLVVAFFRLQAIKSITDASRALNKRFGNPAMMRLAGRRYFFAGVIWHKGRRSGREYATPIWAVPTTEGFVIISLPFGEGADWLKNVLAAGQATLETRGEPWVVAEPEVIDRATAWPLLPQRARLLFGLAGIERYLKLRRLSEPSSVTVG
ncbi:MAG TPA: nitroreductase family deazaflavin-dependent oxidoreductase [Rubrobacter sp.]|nr:nitroreductase family deazaflavin-dependent oxidoreductase [Rubrobacter sp.]